MTVTDYLQQLSTTVPYADAVNHQFLRSAGEGTIERSLFSLWLSQDRIYAAYAYPRFIGSLIAAIPFDKSVPLKSAAEAQNRRILKTLTAALENIIKEVEFFVQTADTHRLDLEIWRERKGTMDYIAEMDSIAGSKNIQDGLVFLWAMEKVYLDAWTFVRTESQKRLSQPSSPNDVLVAQFVKNWTFPEFGKFVDELADLVNATDIGRQRAAEIWERVIELEKDFWPLEGEEIHGLKNGELA
ncbi:heme oxygenase-like protein [Mycena capillaripes]|nr:heme oxygenase-like protein [Mycena capillaripes]